MFDWFLVLMLVNLAGKPIPPTFIPVPSYKVCMEAVEKFFEKETIPPGHLGVVAGCGKRTPEGSVNTHDSPFPREDNNPFPPAEQP